MMLSNSSTDLATPNSNAGAWHLNPRKFECRNNLPTHANVNLGGVSLPSRRGRSEGRTSTASGSGRHLIMAEGHRIIHPGRQVHSVGHGPYRKQVMAAKHKVTWTGQQVMVARHRATCPGQQVMAARSHTLGSKFRKATSQVHEPSRQQVRVVGHRFSCPGWHCGSKFAGPWVLQAANKGSSQEPFGDNRPSYFIIFLQEVITWH